MRQPVIENPILNSPYEEPGRHFKFDDEGITNEVVGERRLSSYFVPVAQPRKIRGAPQPIVKVLQRRTWSHAASNPPGGRGLRGDSGVATRRRWHRIDSSSRLGFAP